MADLPKKFRERMERMLSPQDYQEFMKSYEQPRQYGLRVNTRKITTEEFVRLAPFHLEPIPWTDNGFFYQAEDMPSKHPYYQAGLYYLQEPSAMAPAAFLPVAEGDRVLDLCAAPGGKATQLGSRIGETGLLVANEISASRARALLKNIELAGITNVLITNEKPGSLVRHFPEFFDKILVDAPCSGEGMFRKEPEVAEAWDEKRPAYFAGLQKDILHQAAEMLRPGGLLLYSTCTFSQDENEGSIARFLQTHPQMEPVELVPAWGFSPGEPAWGDGSPGLAGTVRIWPHKVRGEGHFMALLKKQGDPCVSEKASETGECGKGSFAALERQQRSLLEDFFSQVDSSRFPGRLEVRNQKVYRMPELLSDIKGLKFLRCGLLLGELKKNRFEPEQPFAMALKAEEYNGCINLEGSDPRVLRYLKGETILQEKGEDFGADGWKLICVDGFSLGWGKLVKGVVKNKYLNAWRIF